MDLKGSQTEQNLKDAFAGESQANRRYLYFAAKADVEGYNDVSAVFRSTAEGETGHAHGHLEYLEAVGGPATGLPIGPTISALRPSSALTPRPLTSIWSGALREISSRVAASSAVWSSSSCFGSRKLTSSVGGPPWGRFSMKMAMMYVYGILNQIL